MNLISTGIISLLAVVFISLILYSILRKKTSHHITPPHQHKVDCPVLPINDLRKCDPKNPDSCKDCKDGEFACFTVDEKNPYRYSTDPNINCTDCEKDPTKSGCEKCINIPEGNWCLPIIVESDKCNQYTSIPILTKVTDKEWKWRCLCKYPDIVNKANIDANCTEIRACATTGEPTNVIVCPDLRPDCCKTDPPCDNPRCDPKNLPCTPGESWYVKKNYDPTLGECACPPGQKSYKYFNENTQQLTMSCRVDFCKPDGNVCPDCGYSDKEGACVCGTPKQNSDGTWTSFIRCPDDMVPGNPAAVECGPDKPCSNNKNCYKKCVPDPCNPYGYYDRESGTCKCTGKNHINTQYGPSPVGWICTSPCTGNIPCGGTGNNKRGDCYVDSDNKPKCKNCLGNKGYSQDKNNRCEKRCLVSGQDCSGPVPCCSGNCKKVSGYGVVPDSWICD